MFGEPRVLLEITVQQKGKQAEIKKPILRVGEREGSIEIVSVDVDKGIVQVRNRGELTKLTFEKSKAKPAPTTVAKGRRAPYIPGRRAVSTTRRPTRTAAMATTGNQPIVISSGSGRSQKSGGVMVLGGTPAATTPAAATRTTARVGNVAPHRTYTRPPTTAGLRTIPTRPVRTQRPPSTSKRTSIDPAQQLLILKAQQLRYQQQGIPAPPLPPQPGMPGQ